MSVVALFALAACGDGGGDEKKATQVAAKVNKDEITVHQVNAGLPRLNNPTEAQSKAAGKQTLERLIDQQLFIQKAVEAKLDRDPQVMTAIENAKREILARAYLERAMAHASKPSAEEVTAFFGKHPELFSERRLYRLQEVAVQVPRDQQDELRAALREMKSLNDVVAYAKQHNLRVNANTSARAAEQLPMELAARLHAMKDGEVIAVPNAGGITVLQIVQSQTQPLTEQQATPFIEQFLTNRARMEMARADLKGLREAAKIEYVGDFAGGPPAPAEQPAAVPETKSPAEQIGQQPAAGGDDDFLEKGLSGLKK
ncbi:MAG: EpsD family peptidyl-prolyl cis-trans isomerase [Burkholderiales bacterium]|nr:EpsD family peptidyl-prolyl cis-trans isomerase [Burkholderiales bacterium]